MSHYYNYCNSERKRTGNTHPDPPIQERHLLCSRGLYLPNNVEMTLWVVPRVVRRQQGWLEHRLWVFGLPLHHLTAAIEDRP